jgi:tRNA/rRNA methyltransferase
MAPNAHEIINSARIVGSVAEAIAGFSRVIGTTARERRFGWPVIGPAQLCAELQAERLPTAILFGPETTGLGNDDLKGADQLLRLPTAAHASLNLSMSVSVTGAWLRGFPSAPPRAAAPAEAPPLPAGLRAGLIEDALAVLDRTPYFQSHSRDQAEGTLHRLLGAVRASARELSPLRRMLKSVRYALPAGPTPPSGA